MGHINYYFRSYRCWPNNWKFSSTHRNQGSSWRQWQWWQHSSTTSLGTAAEDKVDSTRLKGKDVLRSLVHDFSCYFPMAITWPWLSLCIYEYFTVSIAQLGGREALFAMFYWWTIKAEWISELCLRSLGKTVSEKKHESRFLQSLLVPSATAHHSLVVCLHFMF